MDRAKIESILKITTVHCVTRVVAQKTRFNNICKFPRNNPIQNPPFSFSNAQTSTKLDADFRLIYSKVSIIRPGRSRLLEFEKKIVLVV